jgi:hypothetical protein
LLEPDTKGDSPDACALVTDGVFGQDPTDVAEAEDSEVGRDDQALVFSGERLLRFLGAGLALLPVSSVATPVVARVG